MSAAGEARIIAAIGVTGSGKSLWVKRLIRTERPRRVIVWDFKREYAAEGFPATEQLGAVLEAAKRPQFRIAYCPPMDRAAWRQAFELVCRIAATAGDCWLVVEELAFVTSPMSAPPAWRFLTLTGRHHGMTVVGLSQRPASVDKDFLGNATTVHCGRLTNPRDVKAMADVLLVPREQIQALGDLQWIERDTRTSRITTGKLTVRRPAPS